MERCKPQEGRDNFHLRCQMAFCSVNVGFSSLIAQAWKGPGSVRKSLLVEFGEDLVKECLSNSKTTQGQMCSSHTVCDCGEIAGSPVGRWGLPMHRAWFLVSLPDTALSWSFSTFPSCSTEPSPVPPPSSLDTQLGS